MDGYYGGPAEIDPEEASREIDEILAGHRTRDTIHVDHSTQPPVLLHVEEDVRLVGAAWAGDEALLN